MRATHYSLFQASNGSRNVKFIREKNKEPARHSPLISAALGWRLRYGQCTGVEHDTGASGLGPCTLSCGWLV